MSDQSPVPETPSAPAPAAPTGATSPYTQPYAQTAGYAPGYAPMYAPPTNTLAIISLVLSVVGVHIAGIICGHIALNQIKRTGEGGRGLALAGLIVGYVVGGLTLLFILYFVVLIGIFGVAAASGFS